MVLLDLADGRQDVLAVPVRGIHDDHVDLRLDQRFDPIELHDPGGGADSQPASLVAAGRRVLSNVFQIPHGDQTRQSAFGVDDQELLDASAVQNRLRRFGIDARCRGDQILMGHHITDTAFAIPIGIQKLHVPPRQDADQPPPAGPIVGHRESTDALLPHEHVGPIDGIVRPERHRIGDHPVLASLDLLNLPRLLSGREILVDDPKPAFLRERDRQRRLRDGVHRCGNQRDVEADATSQSSRRVG